MLIPNQQEFTVEYAIQNFNQILECAEKEAIVLSKNGEKKFLLIDQEVLESWIETLNVLQDQEIIDDIQAGKIDYEKGETLTMEDVFG